MAKISFAVLALLALCAPSAALAAPCRIGANEAIGGFAPASIIASEANITLVNIERVQGAVSGFAVRAVAAIDRALACMAANKQTFLNRYDAAKLAEALRGAYQRYGVPPKDRDGKDNYGSVAQRAGDLAPLAAVTRDRLFAASRQLLQARALIGALPATWAGYGRTARTQAGLPAAMRTEILKDVRQHSGVLADYLRYLEIALIHWSEVEEWMGGYAWPQLILLQGRRAWHEQQSRAIGAEKAGLDRAWKALAERGRDQRAINPHYAQLAELDRRERECVDGIAAASQGLGHRIQVAALIPYLEPFAAAQAPPVFPTRPAAPRPMPTHCAASLDPDLARKMIATPGAPARPPNPTAAPAKPDGG